MIDNYSVIAVNFEKKDALLPNPFVPIDSKLIFGNISTGIPLNADSVKKELKQLSRITIQIESSSQMQEINVPLLEKINSKLKLEKFRKTEDI